VEENSNTQRTPFLFTAKELDEETGLYYFGARYYDPRTSVWVSADPILQKYLATGNPEQDQHLPGMGGVFNSLNMNLYGFSHLNPVVYKDPDGNVVGKVIKEAVQNASARMAVHATAATISAARQRAVGAAWKMEKQLVEATGKGTRNWTATEKKELLSAGKVKGYEGHHTKNVKDNPKDAGNPDYIKFVKGRDEHIAEHGGNFKNPTPGELIDRTAGGTLPRLADEQGYSIKGAALSAGAAVLSVVGTVAEAADYLDPLTYLFHMQEVTPEQRAAMENRPPPAATE